MWTSYRERRGSTRSIVGKPAVQITLNCGFLTHAQAKFGDSEPGAITRAYLFATDMV
jgi:hypothetical protein